MKVDEPQQEKKETPEGKGLETLKNQLLRLQADFENARRRWAKEQAEIQETANRDLLRQLLDIYDDFQRAVASFPGKEVSPSTSSGRLDEPALSEVEAFRTGVEMIAKRLESFLKSYGVVPIEAEGKPFDSALHEAVAHEATDAVPETTVLTELRKGFMMNGRVLRHSVVKVAVKPEKPSEEPT